MLIETSARISPLASIGIAVRNTSRGGGIRNGLKRTVERNCQVRNAIRREAAASNALREAGQVIHERARKGGSAGEVSGVFTTEQAS